jgi:hypothetical protein
MNAPIMMSDLDATQWIASTFGCVMTSCRANSLPAHRVGSGATQALQSVRREVT